MNYRKKFMEECASLVKRDGFENLLAWLTNAGQCDFFVAPASTKYHSNKEGGLCEHTYKVFKRLVGRLNELKTYYQDLTEAELLEKIAVVALVHDLCKCNAYGTKTRNIKDEAGKWHSVEVYEFRDELPLGHAPKSLFIAQSFMRISRDEAAAILAHMGDFADNSTSSMYQRFPLAVMLHVADLEATYLDEEIIPAP